MKKVLVVAIVVLAACMIVFAQGQKALIKYVAVVETEVDPTAKGVSKADVKEITSEILSEAMNNLPKSSYRVMTSTSVLSMGSEVLEQCAEENCVIALGRTISADYIVRGRISKLRNNMFTFSVEMYDTDNSTLVANTSPVRTAKFEDLFEKSRAACAAMYKKFLEDTNPQATQQQTVAQPAPQQTYTPPPPPPQQTYTPPPAPQQTYTPPQQTYTPPSSSSSGNSFTDSRDGKTYRTVSIGGKTWMAENLNYQTGNSVCYVNNSSNCQKYGRLYDWNTARTACPAGWHLPTDAEWDDLAKAVGGKRNDKGYWGGAGKKLKSKSGWKDNGNGTDDYGFSALPGGYGFSGSFYSAGNYGFWWSATEDDAYDAWRRDMGYDNENVNWYDINKNYQFSARCLED